MSVVCISDLHSADLTLVTGHCHLRQVACTAYSYNQIHGNLYLIGLGALVSWWQRGEGVALAGSGEFTAHDSVLPKAYLFYYPQLTHYVTFQEPPAWLQQAPYMSPD